MTEHRRSLALGAAMLTGFSLLTKFMGMGFRLYLTARIGAEGIGLFQVIMSVFSLFATFASAGFTVAVSKLAAQRSEAGSITTGAVSVFRKAVAVSMVPALTGFAVLTFFGTIARLFVGIALWGFAAQLFPGALRQVRVSRKHNVGIHKRGIRRPGGVPVRHGLFRR